MNAARWSFLDVSLGSAQSKVDLFDLKEATTALTKHPKVGKHNILGQYCEFIKSQTEYPEGVRFGLHGRAKNRHLVVSDEETSEMKDLRNSLTGERVKFVVQPNLAKSMASIIPRSRNGLAYFDTTRFESLNLVQQKKVGKIAQQTIQNWPAATAVVTYDITDLKTRPVSLMDRVMHGGCNRVLMAEIFDEAGDVGVGVCIANPPPTLKGHLQSMISTLADLTSEGESLKSRVSWLTPYNFDDQWCPDDNKGLELIYIPPELHLKALPPNEVAALLGDKDTTPDIDPEHVDQANVLHDWTPTAVPPEFHHLYRGREQNYIDKPPATNMQTLSEWYCGEFTRQHEDERDNWRMYEWIRLNKKFK